MPQGSLKMALKIDRVKNYKEYKKLLKSEYDALKQRIQEIMRSDLGVDEKKRQIDIVLEEFRNIGERKVREALPSAYENGRIESGMPVLVASPTRDKYIEMQLTGLNDFIEKIRHYLYKVILSQGD